jgi:hypothetical protein
MIARLWKGHVPVAKAEAYLKLMQEVALPDYGAIAGNLGAWVLHRAQGDLVEIQTLSFWDGWDSIARFAGEPLDEAKYYGFDPDFLIELAPKVLHYEVLGGLEGRDGAR